MSFYRDITINTQPDWKTQYPPEQVGAYLIEHEKNNAEWFNMSSPGAVIKFKPGMFITMPPEPTLDNFLRWVAKSNHKEPTN